MGLEGLAKLMGRWSIEGEAQGQTCWRWAQGKRFLFQDFDIRYGDRHHTGLEVIGHLQRLNEAPSPEIWSRAYHLDNGLTLDYVYEMEGDVLTIWFRHKGSDNCMRGRFSPDATRYEAQWEWPGGGYRVQGKRLDWPGFRRFSLAGTKAGAGLWKQACVLRGSLSLTSLCSCVA